MMKNGAINSSKRACKILAERKLLSAVPGLTRDENWYFSIYIYMIINKLSFKKWHWKVPYSPPVGCKRNVYGPFFFMII